MKTKKEINEEIERIIDHYTPYRPILDCSRYCEVRKVMGEFQEFINGMQ